MNEKTEKNSLDWHKKISALVTVMLFLAVAICLYATTQVLSNGYVNFGGFMMFRVVTGSMEPSIPVGSLLITQETDIENVKVDDVICFKTRVQEIWGKIVTHRVVGIYESEEGKILLETKGDANPVTDVYFVEESNFVGKVIWHTGDGNMFADVLSVFTSKIGFLGFIALPSLLLAALILKSIVGNVRQELHMMMELEKIQEAGKSEKNDPIGEITEEEYSEMYERIRTELIEELMHFDELQMEQNICSEEPDNE